jgi:hypothetical protein
VISCLVGGRQVSKLLVRPGKQETKKRKKSMQTKTNRRGLAIGAAIALVGSFFGAAPASYATTDGAYIDIRPLSNADTANFGGLLTEDFPVYAQLKSGEANANANFATGKLVWIVERVSGALDVLAVAVTASSVPGTPNAVGIADSAVVGDTSAETDLMDNLVGGANTYSFTSVASNATSKTVSGHVTTANTGYAPLYIRAASASGITSSSPNLVVKVTAFIDDLGVANGRYDTGEWFTSKTITLYASSRLEPTVSVGSPDTLDTVVTASATLTSLNWANLNGSAFLEVLATDNDFDTSATATSSTTIGAGLAGSVVTARAGVVSQSFTLAHSQTLNEAKVVYGGLRYSTASPAAGGGVQLGATSLSAVVSAPAAASLEITASNGVNIVANGSNRLDVRPNETNTIRVLASSNSGAASVATTVTVVITGGTATLTTGSKMIKVNSGNFVGNALTFTVTTGANGVGTFTLATTGFVDDDTLLINASAGSTRATQTTISTQDATYTVTADSTHYVTQPGTAVNLGFSVRDQWGVLSSRTDHYLRVTRDTVAPFNYPTTVSYEAVSKGLATVAFTPAPATATGSATVTVQSTYLQTGAYINLGGSTQVTVTVTSSPMAFSTGLAASRAASVSYFPDTVSWVTVTGNASAAGAGISVTGADLVYRLSENVPATTSGSFRMNAGASGAYSFQVAGLKSGTKVMTLTTGTATTTSQVVVADAGSDMGRTIAWDVSSIESGKTRVITGTLTDMNGNPIDTTAIGRTAGDSGTASILVTYTGTAGIVVGTMPTETDADGKFRVSVLTSAADSGTLTITAVYLPQGSSTVTANKITSVQAVTVAPAAAPEVNAVIGSFNGRWAVRVENAKGSVVSVKAGNRWVKFTSLNNNYLFSRKSVVGRTLAVSVWVDGELQNSQTITIK